MIVASDAAAGRERRRRRRDDRPSGITAAAALLLLLLSAAAAAPAVRAFSAPSNPPSSSSRQHPPPREPLPPFPDPRSPEEAIQNQLYHYRMGELDVAYELYCSPGNKASVGSFNEFERQVTMTPYDLIVGHERADVLLELVNASHGNNGVYGMMEVGDDDEDEEEEEEDEEDEDDEEGEGGGGGRRRRRREDIERRMLPGVHPSEQKSPEHTSRVVLVGDVAGGGNYYDDGDADRVRRRRRAGRGRQFDVRRFRRRGHE